MSHDHDERGIARKYGVRELVYPDTDQLRALGQYLGDAIDNGRSGPVPKMAVLVMLEYLQGTVNRQHITKGPMMSQDEYDALQAPYYLAARIVAKIARDRKEQAEQKGKLYQTTYLTLYQLIELLRSLSDPGCYWLRLKTVPDGVKELMQVLWDFAMEYPEQRKKGRAL